MFYTLKFKSLLIFALLLTAASTSLSLLGELRGGEEAVSVSSAGSGAVLIIDAGHGGLDGGAVGADGTVESGVNLDIALKLAALAAFCGQESVLTRDSEELHYPDEDASIASKKTADQRRRLELINSVPGGVLISIHQNKYTAPQPSGPQVFYNGSGLSSELAGLMQEKLNTELASGGRRVAAPASDSIYLMKNAKCPAVLVECGFLSNPGDLALLSDGGYRTKLAMTMLSAWMESGHHSYGGYI